MKAYAIRCCKANPDDRITWEVGMWVTAHNGSHEFEDARIFASREKLDFAMTNIYNPFKQFGFEFEVHEFAYVGVVENL